MFPELIRARCAFNDAVAAHEAAVASARAKIEGTVEFKRATDDFARASRDVDATGDADSKAEAAGRRLDARTRLARFSATIDADPRVVATAAVARDARGQFALAEAHGTALAGPPASPDMPSPVVADSATALRAAITNECALNSDAATALVRKTYAGTQTTAVRAERARMEAVIAQLASDREAIAQFPLDKLRGMIADRDRRNADLAASLKKNFSWLKDGARAAVDALVRDGVIESATIGSGDPLRDEITDRANRIDCRFKFVTQAGLLRVRDGSILFEHSADFDVWIPWAADVDGEQMTDLTAFREVALPWAIRRSGGTLQVTQ